MAGGFSAWAAPHVPQDMLGGTISSAVIGGTASVIGGGKFENGAATAAFGYLFNYCAHATTKCGMAWAKNIGKGVLGGLTAFGGAAVCTSGVGCALGAPSMAFGLANVSESADWLANGNETVDGRNPIKQALIVRGLSAQNADTVAAFGEVASAGALLNAPVKVLEGGKWINLLPGSGGFRIIDRSTYAPLSQTSGALSEAAGAAWDAWSPLVPK